MSSNKKTIIAKNLSVNEIEEVITVAPVEEKTPLSIVGDRIFEDIVHPCLLRTGIFGCQAAREVKLSPGKCINQRLNYSQIFVSDSDYILFAHSIMQKVQLTSSILEKGSF